MICMIYQCTVAFNFTSYLFTLYIINININIRDVYQIKLSAGTRHISGGLAGAGRVMLPPAFFTWKKLYRYSPTYVFYTLFQKENPPQNA